MGEYACEEWARRLLDTEVRVPSAQDVPGFEVVALMDVITAHGEWGPMPKAMRRAAAEVAVSELALREPGESLSVLELVLSAAASGVTLGVAIADRVGEDGKAWARLETVAAGDRGGDLMSLRDAIRKGL